LAVSLIGHALAQARGYMNGGRKRILIGSSETMGTGL
jgi:hypothetical protein